MRACILVILIIISFATCKQYNSLLQVDEKLSYFDTSLVDHFPSASNNLELRYREASNNTHDLKKYGAWLIVAYQYNQSFVNSLDSLIINTQSINKHTDSCLLLLPIRYDGNIDVGKPQINPCTDDILIPVPSFKSFIEMFDMKKVYLDDDFTLYILETKAGKYLDSEDLLDSGIMPTPWSNGYTKGFSISKKHQLVLFWIDIW